jgi:hypothetical protein
VQCPAEHDPGFVEATVTAPFNQASMSETQFVELPDVTICAVDTINPTLAARALDISISQCRFADAVLVTHESVPTHARIAQIDRIRSLEDYSTFMVKQIAKHVHTPWVLIVQWDGYVLDASRWTDAFYQYDYIGARWPNANPGMDVGNGGFSLRSAKLFKALEDERFSVPAGGTEDMLICSAWRQVLETDYGICFAPAGIADSFSYEYAFPQRPTFGFHGVFNMWRHTEDNAMIEIIEQIDMSTLASPRGVALLKNYCDLRKFACIKAIYQRYKNHMGTVDIAGAFVRNGVDEATARRYAQICEAS